MTSPSPSHATSLHKPGSPADRAFKRLVTAGCDPDWLETMLVALKKFPPGRAQKLTENHKRQMEAVIGDLEAAAGRLKQLQDPMFKLLPLDWTWPIVLENRVETVWLEDLPELLTATIKGLRRCLNERWTAPWKLSTMTAPHYLSIFVEQVCQRTGGKPHYKELSTLIKAATRRTISPKHLKVIVHRPNGGRK